MDRFLAHLRLNAVLDHFGLGQGIGAVVSIFLWVKPFSELQCFSFSEESNANLRGLMLSFAGAGLCKKI